MNSVSERFGVFETHVEGDRAISPTCLPFSCSCIQATSPLLLSGTKSTPFKPGANATPEASTVPEREESRRLNFFQSAFRVSLSPRVMVTPPPPSDPPPVFNPDWMR